MSNKTQIEQFEKAFYSDGFQLGMKVVEAGLKRSSLFDAVAKMFDAIDGLTESFEVLAQQQNQPIACKKGCEWCCHQPVFALDYELDYLQHYINENFDENKRKDIRGKAKQKNNRLASLNNTDLLNSKHPCALLEDGVCLAYRARPMACRIYLSTNLKTCLHFFKKPDDKNNYPALMDLPMRLGRMMNEGFKTALKLGGHQAEEFRIEEKLQ